MTSLLQSSVSAEEAWAALGGRSADLERVQVTGDPAGLLPSRLKVQELMTAAVGWSAPRSGRAAAGDFPQAGRCTGSRSWT